MKITTARLKQIIKEELQTEMDYSQEGRDERFEDALTQSSYEEIIRIVDDLIQDVDVLHLQRAPDPKDYDEIGGKLRRIMDLLSGGGY